MKVLSLFDGISCGQLALIKSNIKYTSYSASEIDKHAISVCKHNFPNTNHIGDVTKLDPYSLHDIDLLIGGSPCQSISNLGDGTGLKGKSSLFYNYLDIKNKLKPKYFLLENVVGKKEATDEITELMGVNPIMINSNLFVPQNRKRFYWNISPIKPLPEKSNIKLNDILQKETNNLELLTEGRKRWINSRKSIGAVNKGYVKLDPEIAGCLTARSDASWNSNYVTRNGEITRLTPVEYERLQGIPDNYTSIASTAQRYKMIGNAWTVDVIAHIFKGLKENA